MRAFQIFFFCLFTRILFKLFSGYDNFQLFGDAVRYDELSDKILAGAGDMDIVAYLTAPLYPYTLAFFKWLTLEHWQMIAVSYQFLFVSISAVCIYNLAQLMWNNKNIATLAALIYILYPMTLWFNFTLAQETTFQAYFICSLYFIVACLKSPSGLTNALAACFFSLAFLTKSHILVLIPFLAIIYFYKGRIKYFIPFLGICFLWTIPHGIKNYKQHESYTLSSHGNASLFLLGHSDETFDCLLNKTGQEGSFSSVGCDPFFVFDTSHYFQGYGLVNQLSVKERNVTKLEIGLKWIKENPIKFFELKIFGLKRFLLPGLDRLQFKFKYWFLSFFAGLLIYIPGYLQLFRSARKDFWTHALMLSLIIICAAIFLVFFPINRFRVITMEPLLCVYAAPWYWRKIQNLKFLHQPKPLS